jgi:hypothetical protein
LALIDRYSGFELDIAISDSGMLGERPQVGLGHARRPAAPANRRLQLPSDSEGTLLGFYHWQCALASINNIDAPVFFLDINLLN